MEERIRAPEWGPLLSFDYTTSRLGENRLSFRLASLFPDPSQADIGPSPLSNIILSSDFPQAS